MKKHLASFRTGWQSENLARYILSNFSFIAQPSTVADDIGSDFFCTIFDKIPNGNQNYLVPKESFAIQIKSDKESFSVEGKTEYLQSLSIPFFVGVINKQKQELDVYSGEYLIPFFVDNPTAAKIEISLCETADCNDFPYSEESDVFAVKFPRLLTIGSNPDSPDFKGKVNDISKACRIISSNITRRSNKEYIFYESFSGNFILVSNKQFIEESLHNRLIKIRRELSYILKHQYIESDLAKYLEIRDLLLKL